MSGMSASLRETRADEGIDRYPLFPEATTLVPSADQSISKPLTLAGTKGRRSPAGGAQAAQKDAAGVCEGETAHPREARTHKNQLQRHQPHTSSVVAPPPKRDPKVAF